MAPDQRHAHGQRRKQEAAKPRKLAIERERREMQEYEEKMEKTRQLAVEDDRRWMQEYEEEKARKIAPYDKKKFTTEVMGPSEAAQDDVRT